MSVFADDVHRRLSAPGVPEVPSDKDRAVMTARAMLRAPNIDSRSDLANLAGQFLRALGLS